MSEDAYTYAFSCSSINFKPILCNKPIAAHMLHVRAARKRCRRSSECKLHISRPGCAALPMHIQFFSLMFLSLRIAHALTRPCTCTVVFEHAPFAIAFRLVFLRLSTYNKCCVSDMTSQAGSFQPEEHAITRKSIMKGDSLAKLCYRYCM